MSSHSDIPSSHAADISGTQPDADKRGHKGPDEADKRGHKGPERRCIVTRATADKAALLRFVRSPDGVLTPDILEKLPGRGAYITPDRKTLSKALDSGAFARSFKGKVTAPDGLEDLVGAILSRRLLGLITMAMKAGRLRLGFDQVRSLAQSGDLAIRLEACDGSADGRGKIRTLAKAVGLATDGQAPPVLGCFTALELGQSLGRPQVVHAAIERGKMAKTIKHDMMRLSGFRLLIPKDWPDRPHEM